MAEQMLFPNGSVVLPTAGDALDVLLVAETFGQRISAYDLESDRVPQQPPGVGRPPAQRPRQGSASTPREPSGWPTRSTTGSSASWSMKASWSRCRAGQRWVYSSALGGSDGQTLFMCTGQSTNPAKTMALRSGSIEAVRVGVPERLLTDHEGCHRIGVADVTPSQVARAEREEGQQFLATTRRSSATSVRSRPHGAPPPRWPRQ